MDANLETFGRVLENANIRSQEFKKALSVSVQHRR